MLQILTVGDAGIEPVASSVWTRTPQAPDQQCSKAPQVDRCSAKPYSAARPSGRYSERCCAPQLLPWLSRPRARCRDCPWSVSPGRSPNPACDSSPHRALHGFCRSGVVKPRIGIGDLAAAVSVAGDRYRYDVEQFDPIRDRSCPPAATADGARRMSFHVQRRSRIHQQTTRRHAEVGTDSDTDATPSCSTSFSTRRVETPSR